MQKFPPPAILCTIPQFYDEKQRSGEKCEIFLMKFSRFRSADSRGTRNVFYFYHYDYNSSLKLQLFSKKDLIRIILFCIYSQAIVQESSFGCQHFSRSDSAVLLFSRRRPHATNSLAKG